MKKINKLLSILLALVIVAGVMTAFPMTAGADTTPYTTSGKCGVSDDSDVEWFAFDDQSMVVFGTGEMRNYELDNTGISTAPWYSYNLEHIGSTVMATKIAVEYGVTAIGDYSFYVGDRYMYSGFIQLKNIDIANTVTSIGKYAFYNQKMEEIIIPPSVTYIGENAFKNCRSLKKISYFGNPADLTWDTDGATDTEFYGKNMVVRILKTYEPVVDDLNARFAYKNITFDAVMDNPYEGSGEELSRNIALYYGATNSQIFGGAAPYIIVGSFDGKKKSVTYGSNGFASCVMYNNEYYILTDNTTGELKKGTVNDTTGKLEGFDSNPLTEPMSNVLLKIRHEYIGTNTVKVIYQLINNGAATISGLKVGGAGDIKIGADDFASIKPLTETVNGTPKQVGFYMKSGKIFDQSGEDAATLGFIGKSVEKTKAENGSPATYYDDSTFFFGEVIPNVKYSAAGAKTSVLIPQRIFEINTENEKNSASKTDEFTPGDSTYYSGKKQDSGMSYYWDNITLTANQTKEFAVLFSVYGASTDTAAQEVVKEQEAKYYTVTWNDGCGNDLLKVPVKENETPPAYSGTPIKASTNMYEYTFSGWYKQVGETVTDTLLTNEAAAMIPITEDTIFIAQYTPKERYFFKKHSLSLDGDIGVNYYVDVTRLPYVSADNVKGGSIKVRLNFRWYDKSSTYQLSSTDYQSSGNCEGLFKAKCSVNAAEMAYDITATAQYSTDDGTTWIDYNDERDIYSVREYGKVILDRNSEFSAAYAVSHPTGNDSYANLRELMIRTLDYGAKAQLAFNRKTNDLATNIFPTCGVEYTMTQLTAEQIGAHTAERTSMKNSAGVTSVGLKYAGSSTVYLSKTSIRHYFTVEDSTLFTEDVINADHGGFEYHTKDHGLYFVLSDIPASKLDAQQEFKLGGENYYFSVLNYSQMVLNSTLPKADKDLSIATYWYNDAANTFFGD